MRYFTLNKYLQKRFNERVYKISIDANFTCPNRDGTKGSGGCIYCDKFGSSSRIHKKRTPIKDQVLNNILIRKTRYKAKKFIAYFQSFTNTYGDIKYLKKIYDQAVFIHPDIIGLSISTRADCLDEEKVQLIASYRKYLPYVSVELGMQSSHDKTLKLINRGETHKDFLKAVELLKKYNIAIVSHVILGLPNETKNDILKTADRLANLEISGIKLHFLIALKNTELENMHNQKKWSPLTFDNYVNLCADFIERMPPEYIIHRTAGSGYPKDIIAPKWIYSNKNEVMQAIQHVLEKRNTHQGSLFSK